MIWKLVEFRMNDCGSRNIVSSASENVTKFTSFVQLFSSSRKRWTKSLISKYHEFLSLMWCVYRRSSNMGSAQHHFCIMRALECYITRRRQTEQICTRRGSQFLSSMGFGMAELRQHNIHCTLLEYRTTKYLFLLTLGFSFYSHRLDSIFTGQGEAILRTHHLGVWIYKEVCTF